VPKKNVPQPSNPLKSFNWSKLPDAKVTGTIWSELDDTKLYTAMELENIDKLFCAYQKNGVAVSMTSWLFFHIKVKHFPKSSVSFTQWFQIWYVNVVNIFIYYLFNDTVSSSDYQAPND
jgi:hypothetical protein